MVLDVMLPDMNGFEVPQPSPRRHRTPGAALVRSS